MNMTQHNFVAIFGGGAAAARYGPELIVAANAASDPYGNEADAVAGWVQTGLDAGANVFESQGVVKNVGSYALHSDADDTPTSGAQFRYGLTDMDITSEYKIEFDWRHIGTGARWSLQVGDNINNESVENTDTTWAHVNTTFTPTGGIVTVLFRETGANDGGIYLDNISIKKILS